MACRFFPCTYSRLYVVLKALTQSFWSNVTSYQPCRIFIYRHIFHGIKYPISSQWLSPLRYSFKRLQVFTTDCVDSVPIQSTHQCHGSMRCHKYLKRCYLKKFVTLNVMLDYVLFIVCLPRCYLCVNRSIDFTWTLWSICA